jgi:hypothetical protein
MDLKTLGTILIAISLYYAVDAVSFALLQHPLLDSFGSNAGMKAFGITHFVFNITFAAFVWQLTRKEG